MSNDFFNASGAPAQGGVIASPNMRGEFAAVAAGFDKLPTLTGNAYEIVYVNAAGAALATVGGSGLLKLSTTGIPSIAAAGTDYVVPGVATASGLTVSATNKLLGRSTAGAGAVEEIACTAAGRAILDDADATAQRATLGLIIGTDVQAYDADTTKNDVANAFTAIQKWAKGADVESANALNVGADGNYFDITGTTAITSIATEGVGVWIKLHFDDILTLTHHATDLILPGGANITTAAGDEAEFVEYAAGDWRCTVYTKASGTAVVGAGTLIQAVAATKTDTFGLASATFTDVTGLTVTTAAMASAGSKVKICVALGRVAMDPATGLAGAFRLVRDSTVIGVGDAAGSAFQSSFVVMQTGANGNYSTGGYSFTWYDSPGDTSAHTYKLQMATESSAQGYINRNYTDDQSANTYASRCASLILVEEFAS